MLVIQSKFTKTHIFFQNVGGGGGRVRRAGPESAIGKYKYSSVGPHFNSEFVLQTDNLILQINI